MRVQLLAFGRLLDLEFSKVTLEEDDPEPTSREEAIATTNNVNGHSEFGFQPAEPWRYPEDRWIES